MHTLLAIVGYTSAVLGLGATFLLAKKRMMGWVLNILSTFLFVWYSFISGVSSLIYMQPIFIVGMFYGLDLWLTKKQKKRTRRDMRKLDPVKKRKNSNSRNKKRGKKT